MARLSRLARMARLARMILAAAFRLADDSAYHFAMNISQSVVTPLKLKGQSSMIEAEAMQ